MKKLLIFLILSAVSSFATTTVTGKIQTLGTGNVTSGAFVRFWLRGCAGNQPRVNGTSVIGPTQGGVFFFDISADSGGNVNGTIYSTRDVTGTGNGDIECGGSKTSVWYGMQIFVSGKGGPEIPIHAKNTATLDITSVTPISTNPTVTAPTGDSTYARLDGGNQPFTANIQVAGITQTGYLSAGGYAVPVEQYGAVGDWNGTTGTDNTAAIQACLNAVTSGQCLLQAKSYKITAPLTITKSNVGLVGVMPVLVNTGEIVSTPSSSVLVITSASADIIDAGGVSTSNAITNNVFRNITLQRTLAPTGTAKGLSLSYSYGAVLDNVTCADSIYCFYFRGVGSMGFGAIENSAAEFGYNGITESAGSLYGFYVDTSGGVFSPSIRFRNNHVASNLGGWSHNLRIRKCRHIRRRLAPYAPGNGWSELRNLCQQLRSRLHVVIRHSDC